MAAFFVGCCHPTTKGKNVLHCDDDIRLQHSIRSGVVVFVTRENLFQNIAGLVSMTRLFTNEVQPITIALFVFTF